MDKEKTTFKVAVASSDGYTVDMHFGKATKFYIYQYEDEQWNYVERRKLAAVCADGEHNAASMQQRAQELSDCTYVTALRIGMGAASVLQQNGLIPLSLPGDLMDALEKIHSYHQIQNLFK